jgi:hypothetical protein
MSLKDVTIDNSVKELEKIKALLELSILKNTSDRESQEQINEILLQSLDYDKKTQTSVADKINIIKKLLQTNSGDKVVEFNFEIKTLSLESVLEDLNKFNLAIDDFIVSFGNNNIIYISKAWEDGTPEYKKENLKTKYVKISDTNTPKQGYTIANSFTFGIQGQIQKLISYLDNDKKVINWPTVLSELKTLAKSSGYTYNDVKIALMGLLRLGNLNQDLYEDMSIDEIANSLIRSVKPIYKSSILWNSLRSLERQINTPLQLVLAEAESYIRKLFPDEKQKRVRENYFFIALTSFVNDSLSMEISNEIKRKKELNEYYSYDTYKESCIKLEMTESNIPTQVLKYGRHIKKNSSIQEESLHNTSMNNIQDKLSTLDIEPSDEDLDFQYYNIHNKKNYPVFNTPVKKDTIATDHSSLGTCFGDRGEDDITTFVKYNNSFYSVPLKNCDVRMQLALLAAMKQGRVNQTLDLLWDENEKYMTKISKDEFNNAKLLGCKPSNRWADKRELTLNLALTTEINSARAHRSESDSYESTNGEEDSEVTALNNTMYSTEYKGRNQRDYSQYKPLYNNDNYSSNLKNNSTRTSDRDRYYNDRNYTNGSKSPYYRTRSNSTGGYRNSFNYRNNQSKDDKFPNYTDRQRYDNGYKRQSSNNYRDNSRSSRDNRSPSGSRITQDRYQRTRSQSANNNYERNRNSRNSNSYERNRSQNRYDGGDRYRSQSRDRQDRYQSNKYNGNSWNKQGDRSRYSREDRSNSRERYRTRERGRSLERRRQPDSRYNRERSTNGRDREGIRSRPTSRDNSLEIRLRYPKFKPGDNCDSNYNPNKVKMCRKCSLKATFTHHEFECRKYSKFNDYPCRKCNDGFHFEKECTNSSTRTFNIGEEESEKNANLS